MWWIGVQPSSSRVRALETGTSAANTEAPADKIEYARLLKAQGASLGAIATKTGIPKTSLHRYLTPTGHPA